MGVTMWRVLVASVFTSLFLFPSVPTNNLEAAGPYVFASSLPAKNLGVKLCNVPHLLSVMSLLFLDLPFISNVAGGGHQKGWQYQLFVSLYGPAKLQTSKLECERPK